MDTYGKNDTGGHGGMDLFNLTSIGATVDGKYLKPDEWRFDIRMGGPAQHVGSLRGDRLKEKLISAFSDLAVRPSIYACPACWLPNCPDNFCKDSSVCCYQERTIDHIVYDSGGEKYATNAFLRVRVWWADIQERNHPGLFKMAVRI